MMIIDDHHGDCKCNYGHCYDDCHDTQCSVALVMIVSLIGLIMVVRIGHDCHMIMVMSMISFF